MSVDLQNGHSFLGCLALALLIAAAGVSDSVAQTGAQPKAFPASGTLLNSTLQYDPPPGIEEYGREVEAIGDIDGNGVVDLAVGAPDTKNEDGSLAGAVVVHRMGADGSILSTATIDSTDIPDGLMVPPNSSGPLFGTNIASIGDIDGNGVPDLAIGAPGDGTSDNNDDNVNDCLDDGSGYPPLDQGADGRACSGAVGALYIVRLDASGEVLGSVEKYDDTHPDLNLDHPTTEDFGGEPIPTGIGSVKFGRGVAFLGDLDGAGGHDFVVVAGAPGYTQDPETEDEDYFGGFLVLELTWDGSSTSLYDVEYFLEDELIAAGLSLTADDDFGEYVSAMEDLDGNGVPELVFGSPYFANGPDSNAPRGAVHIVDLDFSSGSFSIGDHDRISDGTGGLQYALDDNDSFGSGVASAGDLDGNGVPDLLVGMEGDDGPGDASVVQGAALLLFMQYDGTSYTVQQEHVIREGESGFAASQESADRLGVGTAVLPDEDGDGAPSIVLGTREGGSNDNGSLLLSEMTPPAFGAELVVTGRTDNGSSTPDRSDATVDPGDILTYTVTARNTGHLKLEGSSVEVPLDPNLTLVPGSISSPSGSVTSGNSTEETIVVEAWGDPVDGTETVAGGAVHDGSVAPTEVSVTFQATITDPFPAQPNPPTVGVQGEWFADNAASTVTNDPSTASLGDVTETAVDAAPRFVATKTDVHQTDADGDGFVDPGDRLGYTVDVQNLGDQNAGSVTFSDTPDAPAAVDQASLSLTDGSVTVASGTGSVTSNSGTAAVDFGTMTGQSIGGTGESASIEFSADVNDPPEAAAGQTPFVGQVQNQGTLSGDNFADVSTDDPDTGTADDPTMTEVPTSDLSITASVDNASPELGTDVTFTIKVANNAASPDAASGVSLDAALPSDLALVSVSGDDAGTYDPSSGDSEWNPGSVAIGATKSLSVTATLNTVAPRTLSASVAGVDQRDPAPGNDSGSITVEALTADLELAMSAPSSAVYGTTYDYTLTLTNEGPGLGQAVAVTDALPADVSVQSVSGDAASSYDPSNDDDVWNVGDVPSGETRSLTISVQMDTPSGTITNSAEVTAQDTNDPDSTPGDGSGDDFATTDVTAVLPTLAVSAPAPTNEGNSGTTTFDFTVTLSEAVAYPVEVDYATQDGSAATADSDYSSESGTLTFSSGETQKTVSVSVNGDQKQEGDETFDVVLSSSSNASVGTGTATATITGDDPMPELSIDDPSGTEGDGTIDFTITLSNPTAQSVTVDIGTQEGTATAGADYTAVNTTITFPTGTTETTVAVTIADDAQDDPTENFDLVATNPTNATLADGTGTATLMDNDTDLGLAMTASSTSPGVGNDVTFTLTVSGGQTATDGVEVTNALPAGLTFVSATGDQAGTYDPSTGDDVWNAGTVAAGGTATLDVTATLTTADPVTNTAEITTLALNDPNAANNTATVQLTQAEADLALFMTQNNSQPQKGGTITYTIELENESANGQATGVEVTNTLPSGLSFESADPATGAFDDETGVWSLGAPLAAGDVVILELTAAVNTLNTVTNVAEVTAAATNDPDSTPGNGEPTEDDYAEAQADPLPVELTSFDGAMSDASMVLRWETASEKNNAGFRIERREGATGAWTDVGFVDGRGTTSEAQSYRLTDTDLPYDADSLTYRLEQVDTDGSTSYSDPITVERNAVTEVELLGTYPNPARSRTTVRFAIPESVDGADVQLRLYDVMGRQVREVRSTAKAGRHRMQLRTSDLSSGVYFLRLQAGQQMRTRKLTVVR